MAKMVSAHATSKAPAPMGKSMQAGLGGKANRVGGIRTPFTSAVVKGGKLGGGRK